MDWPTRGSDRARRAILAAITCTAAVAVAACGGPSPDELDARCSAAWTAHDDPATIAACRDAARERRASVMRAGSADERSADARAEDADERVLLRETFRLQATRARSPGDEAAITASTRRSIALDVATASNEIALDIATDLARTATDGRVRAYAAERRVEIQRELLALDPTWAPPR
jgi:hypothetical protein